MMTPFVKSSSLAARGAAFAALALATCLLLAAQAAGPVKKTTQTKQQRLVQLAGQKRAGAEKMAKMRRTNRRLSQLAGEKRAGAERMKHIQTKPQRLAQLNAEKKAGAAKMAAKRKTHK